MSRLNLNSIINWINYSVNIVKTNKRLSFICFLSSFFLIFFSPVLGIYFLVPCTIYYIYFREYKNICVVWVFLLFTWYLAFTACLFAFDGPLIIKSDFLGCGPKSEETLAIISYIEGTYLSPVLSYSSFTDFWKATLGVFCMQTYFLISILSSKLGISIYIPSVFKGLLTIYKFISRNNPPANCSPEKESGNSSIFSRMKKSFWRAGEKKGPTEPVNNDTGTSGPASSYPRSSNPPSPGVSPSDIRPVFTGKPNFPNTSTSSTTKKLNDWEECKRMEDYISKNHGIFYNSDGTVVDDKLVTYREVNMLPYFKWKNCNIGKASSKDILVDKILRESQDKPN